MPFMPGKKSEPKKIIKEADREIPEEDEVKLKPIMGISPGHYLTCLYGIILLVILFFVLLYPGISNPGTLVTIKSEPWGAAVLVDGVYMEAAPCEIFIPKGRRKIELEMTGFLPGQTELDIGGRLFASVLFPLRMEIHEKLETRDPIEAFINYASEFTAWSFAGEPSTVYQIPLSLSEGAYRTAYGITDPVMHKSMDETISASARFAVTRAGLRDLVRAKTLLDNHGLSPSPFSLLHSAMDIIGYLDENPEAAIWLGAVLQGEAQSDLAGSSWYAEAAAGRSISEEQPAPQPRGETIQAGSLRFILIPGGTLPVGKNYPPDTKVDSFYVCETLISLSVWERFLEEVPKWKPENIEALIEEELVKEDYLLAAGFTGAPAEGVRGISWYAAKAFCGWLYSSMASQNNYGNLPPMEVRLPTEAEWEYAAGFRQLISPALADSGNFWEWCEDPYVPLNFLSAPPEAAAALSSPERSLKGGSWVNPSGTVKPETRASLPPSFCSPFVSFRPVLAPARTEP